MMKNDHAIVIGGSMAGLLHARVLADHYQHVTIIERDTLPDDNAFRSGTPQSRHLHLLLAYGEDLLEGLFPGLRDDIRAAGGLPIQWGQDTRFRASTGWLPVYNSGINSHVVSRLTLEWLVRRRVMALPNVEVIQQASVSRLLANTNHRRVLGVAIKLRKATTEKIIMADLIVDASGRGSDAPDWLASLGYERPTDTIVNSHLGYATRWYELPADHDYDWTTLTIQAAPQDGITRQAAAFIVEGNQLVVTLAGTNKDYPPTDEDGFAAFLQSLADPAIYDAVKDLTPTSPIYGYRRTASRLRHFEALPAMPKGFIVTGDAACAFNPIYGQGMTTAALEASALQSLLGDGVDVAEQPLTFQKALNQAVQQPWLMATGEDLRYPETEGEQPGMVGRMTQHFVDAVMQTMRYDEALCTDFLRVMNLQAPPTSLMKPRHLLTIARHKLFGAGQPPQTATVPQAMKRAS